MAPLGTVPGEAGQEEALWSAELSLPLPPFLVGPHAADGFSFLQFKCHHPTSLFENLPWLLMAVS